MTQQELTNRTIPGITWKQVVAYTGLVIVAVWGYANMLSSIDIGRKQSRENNQMLQQLEKERKEDKRVDELRLNTMEAQIHQLDLRITIMEKFIEGYNKPIK